VSALTPEEALFVAAGGDLADFVVPSPEPLPDLVVGAPEGALTPQQKLGTPGGVAYPDDRWAHGGD
jgi:hypothetical protein